MKIAPIVTATALLVAISWPFLVFQQKEDPVEEKQAPRPDASVPPAHQQAVQADENHTNAADEPAAEIATKRFEAEEAPEADDELLTKEAIMLRLKELEASKNNNPHHVIDASILNAKLALIKEKEESEKSELTEEEKALIGRILKRIEANDPNAQAELYEYLGEDASPPLYFMAGNFLAQEGNLEGAIDFYLTGLESDKYMSENTKLRMTKNAGIMMVKSADYERAADYLQQAMYLSPEPDGTTLGLLALSQLNSGNLAASKHYYRQAIDAHPDVLDWHVGLAKALLDSGDYKEGIEVLEKIKTMPPKG